MKLNIKDNKTKLDITSNYTLKTFNHVKYNKNWLIKMWEILDY